MPLHSSRVVISTAKIANFEQITTGWYLHPRNLWLSFLPQRQRILSKSQLSLTSSPITAVVISTAKIANFEQITTGRKKHYIYNVLSFLPQRQRILSKSQLYFKVIILPNVVISTAKIANFEQITTGSRCPGHAPWLSFLPQRQRILSKSQHWLDVLPNSQVVISTAKIANFEQITTGDIDCEDDDELSFLPQRQRILSKSQPARKWITANLGCHFYRKDSEF